MNKWLVLKTILILFFLITASKKGALADVVCAPNYGGGEDCTETNTERINLDKEVSFTKNDDFSSRVEGAGAGETVYFKISIKNEGDTVIDILKVEDDLPEYLETDEDTEWTIKNLEPGDEWSETFKAEVVDEDELSDGDTCVVNEARVKQSNKTVDEDTAVVCIEAPTKVLGVKELPVTGGSNKVTGKELSLGVMALGMILLGIGLKKTVQ